MIHYLSNYYLISFCDLLDNSQTSNQEGQHKHLTYTLGCVTDYRCASYNVLSSDVKNN